MLHGAYCLKDRDGKDSPLSPRRTWIVAKAPVGELRWRKCFSLMAAPRTSIGRTTLMTVSYSARARVAPVCWLMVSLNPCEELNKAVSRMSRTSTPDDAERLPGAPSVVSTDAVLGTTTVGRRDHPACTSNTGYQVNILNPCHVHDTVPSHAAAQETRPADLHAVVGIHHSVLVTENDAVCQHSDARWRLGFQHKSGRLEINVVRPFCFGHGQAEIVPVDVDGHLRIKQQHPARQRGFIPEPTS